MLRRLDRFHVTDDGSVRLPYIAGWHQAPVHAGRDLVRLRRRSPRCCGRRASLKYLAGSESGMGAFINDTTPERIADRLREVAG
ncbi:hypothetical protein GCM10025868_34720 [Angustibacter aerolatus]|uniref:Uncharacterized protein n=1 Tax=Angustibacter aerolatus TaxID=1162965 RepID=A0ABQ6JKD3_9ACTN|nr:hypothetical protein GCM10025868_34720 [Angustibacter aerolatus]